MINEKRHFALSNLKIVGSNSEVGVVVRDGIIESIGSDVDFLEGVEVFDCSGCLCYPGFVDVGTTLNTPGYEERESLRQLDEKSLRGGYTDLLALPHTFPIVDNAPMVKTIKELSRQVTVNLWPLGAMSLKQEGRELAELMEMHSAGAVGFTDGYHPTNISGFLLRVLDYVKSMQSIVLSFPYDDTLVSYGQMDEGVVSTRLGLQGIPIISETSRINRDIALLEYCDSKLFVWNVSSKESVEIIRRAKQKGLSVYASVSYLHLIKTSDSLEEFDVWYKVLPPLREKRDREALIQGCLDGTIDVITSQHRAWDIENKMVEFPYAMFGAQSIEVVYAALNTFCQQITASNLFSKLISENARNIFSLPRVQFEKDTQISCTIVDPNKEWWLSPEHMYSYKNQYSIKDTKLIGKPKYIVNKSRIVILT